MSKEKAARREQKEKKMLIEEMIDELDLIVSTSPSTEIQTNLDYHGEEDCWHLQLDPDLPVIKAFTLTNVGGYDEVNIEVPLEDFVGSHEEEWHLLAKLSIFTQSKNTPGMSDAHLYIFYLDKGDMKKKVELNIASGIDIDEDWDYDSVDESGNTDLDLADLRGLKKEVGTIFGLALQQLV